MIDCEKDAFLKILDIYIDHIVKSDNKSLLCRIYGLYTIKSSYFSDLHVIMMENISKNFDYINLREFKFDLKGSINNRKETDKKKNVLKCVNFVEMNKGIKKIVNLDFEDIKNLSDII